MAKIISNALIEGLSGKFGDQIVFRHLRDERTVVCAKPDFSHTQWSGAQKAHRARVKQAAAYAKDASRRFAIYAQLAEGTMKNAYNVALGDWFNPPVIHCVERRDTALCMHVSDDAFVAGVRVTIVDETGKLLERGEATYAGTDITRSGWWSYSPVAVGKVVVEACDLAGNRVQAELG